MKKKKKPEASLTNACGFFLYSPSFSVLFSELRSRFKM